MLNQYRVWIVLWLWLPLAGCSRTASVDVAVDVAEDRAGAVADGSSPDAGSGTAVPGERATSAAQTRGTIGYSALTLTNPFFTVIADNLKSEAAKHGFEVIVDDADRDVKKQSEHVDSYITRGVTAIVINPCDRSSVGPVIKKANSAGIPVFTCDLQCVAEDARVTAHVGTDNYQGGKLAGEAMIEALGQGGGKILILHFKQANSCILRVQGFREVIDAYNEARSSGRIEVAAELEGGGLRDEGFNATAAAIQTDSDLKGIFAINDPSALGAYTALQQAGKQDQVKIIAFDGQLDGKRAIKEGKIYADPIQFPGRMGKLTVERILQYLNGEPFQEVTLIPTVLYRQADALKDPQLEEAPR